MKERVVSYSKYVKEVYPPKINEEKQLEMISIMQGARNNSIR